MKCHYCDKVCRNNVSSWICDNCSAEFFHGHINLYTSIKGEAYTFQMRFEHTQFPARIICPFNFDISGLSNRKNNIINLPKIPDNINPANVNEKVKLFLLFS